MPEEDAGSKTEEPTGHKLGEARKKGQIAKSKEFTSAVLFITSVLVLKVTGVYIWNNMVVLTQYCFEQIPREFSYGIVGKILYDILLTTALILAPIFLVNLIIALLIESVQTQFLFSFSPLTPDMNRINPIEQMKKYFTLKHYMESVKSVIKIIIVMVITFFAIKDKFALILKAQYLSLWQILTLAGSLVMDVTIKVCLFFVVIAILDYIYQRYEFLKSMKMTKKEIKEEYKRLEGDPQIKKKQREVQRKMAQSRQVGAVPGADVVVTNPTHIAIAIQYKVELAKAPVMVAKGKGLFAAEIKRIAEENYVSIIENKLLAQALYKYGEVGAMIPPQFYRVVAEILAFVYNLKKKRKFNQ
jgi:flagellar biosynthetic protein FlhB